MFVCEIPKDGLEFERSCSIVDQAQAGQAADKPTSPRRPLWCLSAKCRETDSNSSS